MIEPSIDLINLLSDQQKYMAEDKYTFEFEGKKSFSFKKLAIVLGVLLGAAFLIGAFLF